MRYISHYEQESGGHSRKIISKADKLISTKRKSKESLQHYLHRCHLNSKREGIISQIIDDREEPIPGTQKKKTGKKKRWSKRKKDKYKKLREQGIDTSKLNTSKPKKSQPKTICRDIDKKLEDERKIKNSNRYKPKKPEVGQSFLIKDLDENRNFKIEIAYESDFSDLDYIYLRTDSPLAIKVCNKNKGQEFELDSCMHRLIEYYCTH